MSEQKNKPESDSTPTPQVSIWTDSPLSSAKRIGQFISKHKKRFAIGSITLILLVAAGYGVTQAVFKARETITAADRASQEAEASQERLEQVFGILTNSVENAKPIESANFSVTSTQVLLETRDRINESGLDAIGKDAMLTLLIDCFRSLEEYVAAEKTSEMQVELCNANFGTKSPTTLDAMKRRAKCLELAGLRIDAWNQWDLVHTTLQDLLGQEHLDVIRCSVDLGILIVNMRNYSRAQQQLESATSALTKKLGDEHPEVIRANRYLAANWTNGRKYDRALVVRKQLFELQKKLFGIEDPKTITALQDLILAYLAVGEIQQAFELGTDELDQCKSRLGENHALTIRMMKILAFGYESANRNDLAHSLRQHIDDYMLETYGDDDPRSVTSACVLSESFLRLDQADQAEDMLKSRLVFSGEKLASCLPLDLNSLEIAANRLKKFGKPDEALSMLKEILDERIRRTGRNRIAVYRTSANVALAYESNDQPFEALELIMENYHRMAPQLGIKQFDVDRTASNARHIIVVTGLRRVEDLIANANFQSAESYLDLMQPYKGAFEHFVQRQIMESRVDVLLAQAKYQQAAVMVDLWQHHLDGDDDKGPGYLAMPEQLAAALTSKAICQLELGEAEDAATSAKKALKFPEIQLVDRNQCESVLAVGLALDDQFEAAEKKAIAAFESFESQLEQYPTNLVVPMPYACRSLIKIYELSGDTEKAKEWESRLLEIQDQIKARQNAGA